MVVIVIVIVEVIVCIQVVRVLARTCFRLLFRCFASLATLELNNVRQNDVANNTAG